MASPAADIGQPHQRHLLSESASEPAFLEAQKWIEAVTGRCFGDKDFRGGLENGILLCELLSAIKPGLVKKINRLPTPIAGLDNLSVFLRGCEELGLKGSQLFDPGDLQDTSTRPKTKVADCSRKLTNVLITIYWLGRAANSCISYNGPTLDLKEFEGLLSQMRKEAEETESPQRSIRDSGYIDSWDSERSDSLSPPRHGREDSFDSLDSLGSRSRQTPSPDVLVTRGIGSDGRGSDSESDVGPHGGRKLPDVRKDDMLARRTSVSEPRVMVPFNQYLPNKSNASGYMPTPLRRKRGDREGREEDGGRVGGGGHKSWSTATSPIGSNRPFSSTPARSCSEELYHLSSLTTSSMTTSIIVMSPPSAGASPETTRKFPPMMDREEAGPKKVGLAISLATDTGRNNDMWARHALTSPKHSSTTGPSQFLPVPAARATTTLMVACQGHMGKSEVEGREGDKPAVARRPSWLDDDLQPIFSHRAASVSDDPESVSMIDVRCEEDPSLPHHSQVRHELMHNQYNMMKEEEDHWQDDLARWKSRRRSVSQDLIKKEEERKMMEKLMTGEGGAISQRRKSIKTYREIVEEKERRENELREAYQSARTPEEAALVLHRYAQRFTISEAVLERLQLPKLLDRSVSEDPTTATSTRLPLTPSSRSPNSTSPEEDPNGPLKYLRQQSLPAPKFTATVEAQVAGFPQGQSHRPQIQSRTPVPSPSIQAASPKSVPLLTPKPYIQSKGTQMLAGPKPGKELQSTESIVEAGGRSAAGPLGEEPNTAAAAVQPSPATDSQRATKEQREVCTNATATRPNATVPCHVQSEHATQQAQPMTAQVSEPSLELSQSAEDVAALADPGLVRNKPPREAPTTELANSASYPPETGNPRLGLRWEFFAPPEGEELKRGKVPVTQVSSPVVIQAKRGDRWAWDPDEERKRQERWQQEQERMLQEKYQREQEKLKQEWERAQREVEEEERRYHEEERRILEETVAPLAPLSCNLPSPIRGDAPTPMDPQDTIVRSLADWERKQELLERQGGSTESVEWKRQDNDRSSDISTASRDESLKTAVSSISQNSSQTDKLTPSLRNGQRAPPAMALPQPPNKKQHPEVLLDCVKPSQQTPSRDRRCGSIETMGPSPLKSPTTCPSDMPPSPNRSVSGKKLCSSCGHPLGKGAAMIIETLSLYFHIQCFKCGVCKGQLGDTTTGTDVRIRNGLLNCHQCYIRSRSTGQPTTL
ncbi:LIM and calponin homology domains-containing protein 1 isoform X11 [Oncorhynchus tshawytscha]|uniref:LIM and calponin homology domains-containing protein 1 isoform X11 n=1 Tax=Oncorhynchus tshawytscha TaxID=74940 RepID=UPI000D0A4D96|nr:LIM and calponin homology domains-containing protein 1 isoform X11 [Oncorhynchus tshawytscha]